MKSSVACLIFLFLSQAAIGDEPAAQGVTAAGPKAEYKGLFQLDIKASGMSRDIIQDIGGGEKQGFTVDSGRIYAQFSVKPLSVLEVYVLGGGGDLQITNVSDNKFFGRLGPLWGAGIRLNLFESSYRRTMTLFLDGSYLQLASRERGTYKIFQDPSTGFSYNYLVDEEMVWREYGATAGVKGRFAFAGSPEGYAGLKMTRVDGDDTFTGQYSKKYSFTEDGILGLVLGGNIFLDPRENAAINVELGIGEPLSLTGGFTLWF